MTCRCVWCGSRTTSVRRLCSAFCRDLERLLAEQVEPAPDLATELMTQLPTRVSA